MGLPLDQGQATMRSCCMGEGQALALGGQSRFTPRANSFRQNRTILQSLLRLSISKNLTGTNATVRCKGMGLTPRHEGAIGVVRRHVKKKEHSKFPDMSDYRIGGLGGICHIRHGSIGHFNGKLLKVRNGVRNLASTF